MGSLITETPYSEITATLEILDRCGVGRDDLKKFRRASRFVQMEVMRLMKHSETKAPSFPVWKTITLGLHKHKAALYEAIDNAGIKVSPEAFTMLQSICLASKQTDVDLVVASLGDFGLEGSATLRNFYVRAVQLGLLLCPAEVGPQLRF